MRRLFLFLIPLFALNAQELPSDPSIEQSIVKIFSTSRYPDVYRPWTRQAPSNSTGTGIIIEGKRILTNAHVVLYASTIQVQAHQSGTKHIAKVEYIAPGIDLAVLKLEDESLFENRPPLPRSNQLPDIKDTVLAYGFPTGGDNLSITKGIVSRIEFAGYNNRVSGLRIQIDAAINPGNSGGPAMSDDKMIGLAFSRRSNAENIGYIIPNEEIDIFLEDIADGKYDGKPTLYASLQTLENHALAPFLKLPSGAEGMIVTDTNTSPVATPLQQWDLVTHIAGTPIDNEGMIKLNSTVRINFKYLVQKHEKNGMIPLTVIRQGESINIQAPLPRRYPELIPALLGEYPEYFIYGPLVFSAASKDFVNASMKKGFYYYLTNDSPLLTRYDERPAFDGEQLVVLSSPMFPHKTSIGYSNLTGHVVRKINDVEIKNLAHLVETIRNLKSPYVVVDFYETFRETLVFSRQEMESATEEILNDNGIRSQATPELLKIWDDKP